MYGESEDWWEIMMLSQILETSPLSFGTLVYTWGLKGRTREGGRDADCKKR